MSTGRERDHTHTHTLDQRKKKGDNIGKEKYTFKRGKLIIY